MCDIRRGGGLWELRHLSWEIHRILTSPPIIGQPQQSIFGGEKNDKGGEREEQGLPNSDNFDSMRHKHKVARMRSVLAKHIWLNPCSDKRAKIPITAFADVEHRNREWLIAALGVSSIAKGE